MKLKDKKKIKSVFELLTNREMEIINLIFDGKRVIEIAEILKVKLNTISTIKNIIYNKTGVDNNIDLYKLALKEGYHHCNKILPPLNYQWNFIGNPDLANYSLSEENGSLLLRGNNATLSDGKLVTFVGRRQEHKNFTASTLIDFNPKNYLEEAGLTIFMGYKNHCDVCIKNIEGVRTLLLSYNIGMTNHVEKQIPILEGPVELYVEGISTNAHIAAENTYSFKYKQNCQDYIEISTVDAKYLSSEAVSGFSGVFIGLYATGNGNKSNSIANFHWFAYNGVN